MEKLIELISEIKIESLKDLFTALYKIILYVFDKEFVEEDA